MNLATPSRNEPKRPLGIPDPRRGHGLVLDILEWRQASVLSASTKHAGPGLVIVTEEESRLSRKMIAKMEYDI
jgi:hypothetical protein